MSFKIQDVHHALEISDAMDDWQLYISWHDVTARIVPEGADHFSYRQTPLQTLVRCHQNQEMGVKWHFVNDLRDIVLWELPPDFAYIPW